MQSSFSQLFCYFVFGLLSAGLPTTLQVRRVAMPLGRGGVRPNNGDYAAMVDGSGHGEALGGSSPQYLFVDSSDVLDGGVAAEPQRHTAGAIKL